MMAEIQLWNNWCKLGQTEYLGGGIRSPKEEEELEPTDYLEHLANLRQL